MLDEVGEGREAGASMTARQREVEASIVGDYRVGDPGAREKPAVPGLVKGAAECIYLGVLGQAWVQGAKDER